MYPNSLNKERFSCPNSKLLSTLSEELVDWWGRRLDCNGMRVVHFDGKHWFVKFKHNIEEMKRDYLAYILGRNWTNIAEVRPLSEREFTDLHHIGIVTPKWATVANTFLVRLGQDYVFDQLPNTDIDSAVACELIFSLWTRRRDTHAANRAYINGIPVFFDHQTSFLGEAHLRNLDVFFSSGQDAGYAGRWRVEIAAPETTFTTLGIRRIGKTKNMAIHYIRDYASFNKAIQDASEHILRQSREEWFQAMREVGYCKSKSDKIITFLEENCAELGAAIERMRSVIFEH
jgi:hypothetical protein